MKKEETKITLDELTLKQEFVLRACIVKQPKDYYLPADNVTEICDIFCKLNNNEKESPYVNKDEFNTAVKSLLRKGYLSLFSGSGIQVTTKGMVYVEKQSLNYLDNRDFDTITKLDYMEKEFQRVAKHKAHKK